MPEVENDHIVQTTNEARSATTGHGARYVLAIGVISTVVLFAIVYLYFFA